MNLSNETKVELISAANTFVATFFVVVGTAIADGNIQWTVAFWSALGLAALRSGIKAIMNQFLPVKLGGVK